MAPGRLLAQVSLQINQPMAVHKVELIASANTHGHDEEYLRAEGAPTAIPLVRRAVSTASDGDQAQ